MNDRDRIYIAHVLSVAASGARLVFYDIETTGLDLVNQDMPRAWDLGAVERHGARRVAAERLINVGAPLPPAIVELTRVAADLPLRQGSDERVTLARFGQFIAGAVLVGHNIVDYDNRVLAHAYHRLGLPIPAQLLDQRQCIDTLLLSQAMYFRGKPGSPPNNKLETMARFLGIDVPAASTHRALPDTLLTEQIFDALIARARALNIDPAGLSRAA